MNRAFCAVYCAYTVHSVLYSSVRCGKRKGLYNIGMHLFFYQVYSLWNPLKMKSILLFFLFFTLSLFSAEITGKVIKIADGDTITILDSNNRKYKIRLDKIDAPELRQYFGINAKNHLVSLISGKQVKVIYRKKDRYKRILGIVYLHEKEINLQMVKDGFAWHYSFYDKSPEYIEAEQKAKQNKSGLWIQENPVNPYKFRKNFVLKKCCFMIGEERKNF